MPKVYMIEIYCQNSACAVRECKVHVKDHDDTHDAKNWHCPSCGSKAKIHWKHTMAEYEEMMGSIAVTRVNCALYHRERAATGDISQVLPGNVLAVSDLPDSWHSVTYRPSKKNTSANQMTKEKDQDEIQKEKDCETHGIRLDSCHAIDD